MTKNAARERIEDIECQKIVNRVMSILGKNINIMNSQGLIIASGNAKRIGTYHEAARLAVQLKREVIVENDTRFVGCKKGINLPIYNHAKVIGVIGITGDPAEVKGYGVIVKELVELMIQEAERNQAEQYQQQARKNLAIELIKENAPDLDNLTWKMELVNFDIHLPRVIMVADIFNFASVIERFKTNTEVCIQECKQTILNIIHHLSDNAHDISFNFYEDRFVIVHCIDSSTEEFIHHLAAEVKQKLGITLHIGVGCPCREIKDYYLSYSLANSALEIGRKIKPEESIYHHQDYRLETLLQSIPKEKSTQFTEGFSRFLSAGAVEKDLILTVKTYFEQNMNIKRTAEALYVHRNTVLYRLDKWKEKYHIDVMNTYTCMLLYLTILMKELE